MNTPATEWTTQTAWAIRHTYPHSAKIVEVTRTNTPSRANLDRDKNNQLIYVKQVDQSGDFSERTAYPARPDDLFPTRAEAIDAWITRLQKDLIPIFKELAKWLKSRSEADLPQEIDSMLNWMREYACRESCDDNPNSTAVGTIRAMQAWMEIDKRVAAEEADRKLMALGHKHDDGTCDHTAYATLSHPRPRHCPACGVCMYDPGD